MGECACGGERRRQAAIASKQHLAAASGQHSRVPQPRAASRKACQEAWLVQPQWVARRCSGLHIAAGCILQRVSLAHSLARSVVRWFVRWFVPGQRFLVGASHRRQQPPAHPGASPREPRRQLQTRCEHLLPPRLGLDLCSRRSVASVTRAVRGQCERLLLPPRLGLDLCRLPARARAGSGRWRRALPVSLVCHYN